MAADRDRTCLRILHDAGMALARHSRLPPIEAMSGS